MRMHKMRRRRHAACYINSLQIHSTFTLYIELQISSSSHVRVRGALKFVYIENYLSSFTSYVWCLCVCEFGPVGLVKLVRSQSKRSHRARI